MTNAHRSTCKVSAILASSLSNLDFLDKFPKKSSNIKFHENPPSGSQVVPCEMTDGWAGGHTLRKLIVAIHNFANAPKTQ